MKIIQNTIKIGAIFNKINRNVIKVVGKYHICAKCRKND